MNCININSPEFKALSKTTGIPSYDLDYMIAKWQENNDTFDFPTADELIQIENGDIIIVKEGVEELFESNPELANIGTQEQYSQYLDTIFPDSQVKDIVYRGGEGGISEGQYYTLQKNYAERYGKAIPSILNLSNPVISDRGIHRSWVKDELTDRGIIGKDYPGSTSDAVIEQMNGDEPFSAKGEFDVYVIKNENQKHILGSKQDIEGFKKFAIFGNQLNDTIILDDDSVQEALNNCFR